MVTGRNGSRAARTVAAREHFVIVWTRDYAQTRFAWSCTCGKRWAPQGCTDPHPNDLPSKEAASVAGREHFAVKAA